MKETSLSDKISLDRCICGESRFGVFLLPDVRKAVRKLKDGMHNHSTLWLEDKIDEIFGDDLT